MQGVPVGFSKVGRTQSQGASVNFSRAVGEFRDYVHLPALARKRESAKMMPTTASIPKEIANKPLPFQQTFYN